jgi:transposase
MTKNKRRRFSADFKAKVALEAIQGELTMSELAKKHGVHPNMISGWKRHAIEGMAGLFDKCVESAAQGQQSEVEKLHAKIGQLVVERDFLSKAFKS